MKTNIKSKQRISDHGEVFTNEREVNAMLDLVNDETERIESRFFEPACGDGNFLIKVLERKLSVVERRYKKNSDEYERYSILALSSIYGVELLEDNTNACRNRLYEFWNSEYIKNCKNFCNNETRESAKYIIQRNILNGDALTLRDSNENPIIFSEWSAINSNKIKRRDFRLDQLLEAQEEQISIFTVEWEFDKDSKAFIPKPVAEFPPTNYKEVYKHG